MSIPRTVAEVLRKHGTLEVEGIDRMYLNVYVPALQRAGGVASFFRFHRGHQFASSALMDPITKAFIAQMEQFAKQEKVPIVPFEKGQRKDDVAAEYRKRFTAEEGVLFIGKAQEKTPVFRTERRRQGQSLLRYCMDRDFGPFFLKFCTYFPYNAKLCLNGESSKPGLSLWTSCHPTVQNSIPLSGSGNSLVDSACTTAISDSWKASSKPWGLSLQNGPAPTRPSVDYAQLLKTLCLTFEYRSGPYSFIFSP